jgi:hypothetical protein
MDWGEHKAISEPVPIKRGRPAPINSMTQGNGLGIDRRIDQLQTVCIGLELAPYSL